MMRDVGGHPAVALADPIALWVVAVSDLGGVARHVLDVAARGIPGYRLVVLCPEGPLAERLRQQDRPVMTAAFGQDAGLHASVMTVRHAIAALRPAVVHSHLAWADVVTAVAAPMRGGPRVVSTEHGIAADDSAYHATRIKARTREAMHHLRLRRVDAAIAVSSSTADVMRDKWAPRAPVTVILNGVDRPPEVKPSVSGLRVLSISRLAPEKRITALVRAFAEVARSDPAATLTIAGDGPERGSLERLVHDLGLSGRVSMPGHVDSAGAMTAADVLVQLSVWENASYSLLDGCAYGLGVVASPVGGNAEILPSRCLVDSDDPGIVADRIVEQGTDLSRRPGLPVGWPDVAGMCRSIAEVYNAARG